MDVVLRRPDLCSIVFVNNIRPDYCQPSLWPQYGEMLRRNRQHDLIGVGKPNLAGWSNPIAAPAHNQRRYIAEQKLARTRSNDLYLVTGKALCVPDKTIFTKDRL